MCWFRNTEIILHLFYPEKSVQNDKRIQIHYYLHSISVFTMNNVLTTLIYHGNERSEQYEHAFFFAKPFTRNSFSISATVRKMVRCWLLWIFVFLVSSGQFVGENKIIWFSFRWIHYQILWPPWKWYGKIGVHQSQNNDLFALHTMFMLFTIYDVWHLNLFKMESTLSFLRLVIHWLPVIMNWIRLIE